LDGSADFTFTCIMDVAREYCNQIADKLKALGCSRCLLSGWSYGGVVAVEVTRLLEARGLEVQALALFDAPLRGPGYDGDVDAEYEEEEQLIRDSLVQSIGEDSSEMARLLADRAAQHWRNCTGLLRKHVTQSSPRLAVQNVAHFVVEESSAARSSDFLDDCLARPAALVPVAGVHWTMLAEEHAESLAARLAEFWAMSIFAESPCEFE
jgi:thioesterase domain-containing protein